MRLALAATIAVFVAGGALLAYAVASGSARVALVLVVPVIGGTSAPFLGGVLLVIGGIVALPFALAPDVEEMATRAPTGPTQPPTSWGGGGVVLIGPVPIFWGGWRDASRRTRWAVAGVGAALTLGVGLAWWLLVR